MIETPHVIENGVQVQVEQLSDFGCDGQDAQHHDDLNALTDNGISDGFKPMQELARFGGCRFVKVQRARHSEDLRKQCPHYSNSK
jgi:hypothetical protein